MIAAHRRFLELAAASIDFELSQREHRDLDAHLTSCASCRGDLAALRGDARTIAGLPLLPMPLLTPRLGRPAAARLGRGRPIIRVLAITVMLALVAAAVATVGGEVLRRMQTTVPPNSPPSLLPSPASSPAARVSPPVTPPVLRVEAVDAGPLDAVSSVAAGANGMVAIGGSSCAVDSDGVGTCRAMIWTSPDGSSWTEVPDSAALQIGFTGAPGGVTPGIVDVAAGPEGFAAVGYSINQACTDSLCPPIATVWTSSSGSDWAAAPGILGDVARPHSIAAFGSSWVVVGESYLPAGPRAAVWISDDGATWTPVADGPEFDIGGYLDTGESLGSGGMADVATRNDRLVAAGKRCDAAGGACEVAIWTSPDGRAWAREPGASGFGALRTVAAGPQGFVALGSLCGDASCATGEDRAGGFRSADGQTWQPVDLDVPFPNVGVASVAAGAGFVAVVATETGSRVPVYGSGDGLLWAPVQGALDINGAVVIRDIATVATANGDMLILGWAELDRAPASSTFVFRIPARS
jgi:hypothetical protein